jgi:hypothetical protein
MRSREKRNLEKQLANLKRLQAPEELCARISRSLGLVQRRTVWDLLEGLRFAWLKPALACLLLAGLSSWLILRPPVRETTLVPDSCGEFAATLPEIEDEPLASLPDIEEELASQREEQMMAALNQEMPWFDEET